MGRAAVPSGASTGAHEVVEKRNGDKARYLPLGSAEGAGTMFCMGATETAMCGGTPAMISFMGGLA